MSKNNNKETEQCTLHGVIPRISHLIDENGKKYRLNNKNLEYLVSINKDGTLKYQVVIKSNLTVILVDPVYVV